MPTTENLLAVVEPTADLDAATLAHAHDVVARGGAASVVLLVTPRVRRDIIALADAEGIEYDSAEAMIIARMHDDVVRRVGPATDVRWSDGDAARSVAAAITTATTSVAVSAHLLGHSSAQRLSATTHLPIVVTPLRAA